MAENAGGPKPQAVILIVSQPPLSLRGSGGVVIVVPKTVSPKAVVRNAIKRKVRAATAQIPEIQDYSIAIRCLKPIVLASVGDIKAELVRLLKTTKSR